MSNENSISYRRVGDYNIPNLTLPPEEDCAEIENQAQQMFDSLVEQMKENEGVTEQLKEENQMEWIYRMQNIEARANEITCRDLICA